MFGAGAAGLFDLAAKGFAGAVHANRGVLGAYAGLTRKVVQFPFFQIDNPQGVTIFGLECVQEARDTLANLLPQFHLRLLTLGKLPAPHFVCPRRA